MATVHPASQPVAPAVVQPVVPPGVQPVAPVAPVALQPTVPPAVQPVAPVHPLGEVNEMRIYSHSSLYYWWPVWAVGFLFAIFTRFGGVQVQIGDAEVWMHPSRNLGVFYAVTLFLVILITNVTVRGQASVIVILTILFLTVLFAYLGWWEIILRWLPSLALFANMGFYLFFSILMFGAWVIAVLFYDRLSYWSLRPGQLVQVHVIGGAEKSYDTRGMVFEKASSDLFRHMILGLGSGDIQIITTGARREEITVPNVLFVNRRLAIMQRFIAEKPDQLDSTLKAV